MIDWENMGRVGWIAILVPELATSAIVDAVRSDPDTAFVVDGLMRAAERRGYERGLSSRPRLRQKTGSERE